MRSRRRNNGSMIILVSFLLAVVCVLILIALSFAGLVFQQNRLRTSADEISLAGARALNKKNRIGQMNDMIARCRQLVHSSRNQYDKAVSDHPNLSQLAYRQLLEARDGAALLETQRVYLKTLAANEAKVAVINKYNSLKSTYQITLPWMKVSNFKLQHRYLGKLKDVESNVEELKNLSSLESHDQSASYVSTDPGMKLYKDGINAKLPSPDSSLAFKLSSLPAPVEDTVAPARVALADYFLNVTPDEIPSAVQILVTVDVSTGLGAAAKNVMAARGTASTTGAGKQM